MRATNGFVSLPLATAVVASFLLVASSGCANKQPPPADRVLTPKVDSGLVQESTSLGVGQMLVVRLGAPEGSKNLWQLASGDGQVLAMKSRGIEPQGMASAEGTVSGPQYEVFNFRADEPGRTTLRFYFGQPWAGAEPARRYALDVDVTR